MEKKYQFSKFLGENRDEQIVIRCDTWAEFVEAKKNIDLIINKREEIVDPRTTQAPNKTEKPIPVSEFEKTCQRCGAKMVTNPKTGKIFCEQKCWLKKQD